MYTVCTLKGYLGWNIQSHRFGSYIEVPGVFSWQVLKANQREINQAENTNKT